MFYKEIPYPIPMLADITIFIKSLYYNPYIYIILTIADVTLLVKSSDSGLDF
jgi:hypothetical protein